MREFSTISPFDFGANDNIIATAIAAFCWVSPTVDFALKLGSTALFLASVFAIMLWGAGGHERFLGAVAVSNAEEALAFAGPLDFCIDSRSFCFVARETERAPVEPPRSASPSNLCPDSATSSRASARNPASHSMYCFVFDCNALGGISLQFKTHPSFSTCCHIG